ncbi:MAG: efflux RND transporter periplasmic adaptor subunit [Acidobacteriota bacterium]
MSDRAARVRWTAIAAALVTGVGLGFALSAALLERRMSAPAAVETLDSAAHSHGEHSLYTCGMHPHVLEEEPGSCPICAMDLTPVDGDTAAPEPHAAHDHGPEWTCPDHEMIVENEAGTCPIDGLDLVPRSAAEPSASPASGPAVEVEPAMVQRMNVRTAPVTRRTLSQPIRTVGYLEYDQQRMVTVTTKYSGWIEKVAVNYVGETVQRGQTLFEIYSPELVQTEQELLSALEFAREMAGAPEDASQRARSLVDAARTRLGYWDVSPEQIERLETTGEVFRTLAVQAPASGLVMKRLPGLEGMAVRPGMELFHIADLRSLWLSVELFEDDVAAVREGTAAEITLPYFPGEVFRGRVRFLEPELSEKTRTLSAKIEVPNRGGRLKKGMYATVDLRPRGVSDALTVPLEAVLRTGQRQVVVLALGDGRFEPRAVTLGAEAEGHAQILSGLEEGQEVVTSAQFLLDSESTLREAIRKMRSGAGRDHHHHAH